MICSYNLPQQNSQKVWSLLSVFLLSAIALLGIGCTTSPSDSDSYAFLASLPTAQNKEKTKGDPIEVGDQLQLFVQEDSQFNSTYEVRERGDIIIPVVGRIPVKGLSVQAAEIRVKEYLERNQLKTATIILDRIMNQDSGLSVDGTRRILVYMTGAVNRVGQHRLTVPDGRPLGVYEAILISGGLTRFANEQKVNVIRVDENGKRHRVAINIRPIMQGEIPDPAILQGDVIEVPEKVFGF